jgi:hypothetical protein
MPLFGDASFKVDKYDVRALLQNIPDFKSLPPKKLSAEDEELEVARSMLLSRLY